MQIILITPKARALTITNASARWELTKLTVNFQNGRSIPDGCKYLCYWIGNDGDMRIYTEWEKYDKMKVYDTMRWKNDS